MRNITSLTSGFQTLCNPLRIFNSIRCYSEVKTEKESAVKWEPGINEVKLMGRIGKNPWLSTVQGKSTLYVLVGVPDEKFLQCNSEKEKKVTNWQLMYTQNPVMIKHLQKFVKKGNRVYFTGRLSFLIDENSKNNSANVKIIGFICL